MNLVLYSGGHFHENTLLDRAMFEMAKSIRQRKGKRGMPGITFIPSCSYDSDVEFFQLIKHYKALSVKRFLLYPVDVPTDGVLEEAAFENDIIHLGGGNTFYFLKHLKSSGMLPKLKQFVADGGILTGLSAGAIIMTPTITTATFPSFDCDENLDNLKNYKSLGLVDFEFFPHYKNSLRYRKELQEYSLISPKPLYACPDGSGIVVNSTGLTFLGKAFCFYRGHSLRIL